MTQKNKSKAILLTAGLITAGSVTNGWSADAKAGKATYDKACASCHGADGKGNPAMIKALGEKGLNIVSKETQAKKDAEVLKIIVDGAGKMPPSKHLSQQEQKDLLSYTRSLAK